MKSLLLLVLLVPMFLLQDSSPAGKEKPSATDDGVAIFDGKTLTGWKKIDYVNGGKIEVVEDRLVINIGNRMSGAVWDRKEPFPKDNYEVSLEARRDEGSDFFCGMTFPVQNEFASLIVGGWGGRICGISSINGADASENETNTFRQLKTNQWYKIRLRVEGRKIKAWLDGEPLVDLDATDVTLSTRAESSRSQPFGFATYNTKASLRNIKLKRLKS